MSSTNILQFAFYHKNDFSIFLIGYHRRDSSKCWTGCYSLFLYDFFLQSLKNCLLWKSVLGGFHQQPKCCLYLVGFHRLNQFVFLLLIQCFSYIMCGVFSNQAVKLVMCSQLPVYQDKSMFYIDVSGLSRKSGPVICGRTPLCQQQQQQQLWHP